MKKILSIILSFTLISLLLSGCDTTENERINVNNTCETMNVSASVEKYIRNNLSDDKKYMVSEVWAYASQKEEKTIRITIYVEKANGQYIPLIAEDAYQLALNSIDNTGYLLDRVEVTELTKNNSDKITDLIQWIFESENTGLLIRSTGAKRMTIDELFKQFNISRKGKDEIPDELLLLQGEWKSTKSNWHLIINGYNIDAMYYEKYGDVVDEENHKQYSIDNIDLEGRYIVKTFSKTYFYHITTDGLLECSNDLDSIINTYQKISDNTELPAFIKKKEPYIGMEKSELENSTWGTPKKINRDTTINGTREQWVYDRPYNRTSYVYVTNGIVTAIQER